MTEFSGESLAQTKKIAEKAAQIAKNPYLILLKGDLGTGKTQFVTFFSRALESKDDISSPSFAILNIYDSNKGRINHFDLYRLSDYDELYYTGFEDNLEEGITLIEWPEITELDSRADLVLEIEATGPESRRFLISGKDEELLGGLLNEG